MGTRIPLSLLRDLRCRHCKNFLSCGPVYVTPDCGLLCGRCRALAKPNFRNYVYEELANTFVFPCFNWEKHCPAEGNWNTLKEHEFDCAYSSSCRKLCVDPAAFFSSKRILPNEEKSELIIKLLHHVEDINSTIYFFDVDYSALHVAVNFGLSSVLKYVMQRKPDVNRQTSNFKQTALHVAVRSRYYPEYSRILLKHGADTEIKDDRGRTAFLLAVEYNILEQVQLLLDYKADPLATDYDGQTALHYIFLYHGQVNINLLELLCRKGCFTDSFTHDLQTPIQYLAVRDSTTNKIASAKKLVMFGAHLFTRDIYGDTVLHIAAKFCPEDVRFMQFLLKEGAASGIRNIENQTFIDILKEKSFTNTLEIIKFQVLGEKIGCFQFTERLLESINNDSRLSSFLVECRNQMNILITKSFSPQFYLFDVLTSGEKFLVKFSRHSRVASLIEEFDAKEFPLYETDIKHKLAKVMTLYKAHFSCYNFLRNVSDGKLSYYSVMDILKFLSAKDVMRLDKTLRNSFKDLITDA